MNLALQVQQALGRDLHAGDLDVFRSVIGELTENVWHGGRRHVALRQRLERSRFTWPLPADGVTDSCLDCRDP